VTEVKFAPEPVISADTRLAEEARITDEIRNSHSGLRRLDALGKLSGRLFRDKASTVTTIGGMLFVAALPSVVAEADRAIQDASGFMDTIRLASEITAAQILPTVTGAIAGADYAPITRWRTKKALEKTLETINEKEEIAPSDIVKGLVRFPVPVTSKEIRHWLNGFTSVENQNDPRMALVHALEQKAEEKIVAEGGTKREMGRKLGVEKNKIINLFNEAQLMALRVARSKGRMRSDAWAGFLDAGVGAATIGGIAAGVEMVAGPGTAGYTGLLDDAVGVGTALVGTAVEKAQKANRGSATIIPYPRRGPLTGKK
jgi:hypothetical protein